jgi:hypothetical protein
MQALHELSGAGMEEKGSGIPVEDLAKESGGRHGAMEHAHCNTPVLSNAFLHGNHIA